MITKIGIATMSSAVASERRKVARRLPAVFCVKNNQTALSTPVSEQSAARKAEVLLIAGVLLTVSLGGVLIARRNLRLGRGDRRGARGR